ncbi:ATP-dependent DNA helicase PIF1 [Trifolium medium]|uniref:ATP-dependent DNA helicase PIF1 n=1 Tax=Trifolium medium TaxID=97028 RepID=A0A392LX88_9FABA|nr:ATP-dependent DNA helicase PIF1 [Trifolium medium]
MSSITMANSGIYVKLTKISEITGGKIDFQLRVRVINLWSTPDRADPTEEGALHMIFLDKDCGRIYANVRKDLLAQFKDDIEEGAAYIVERFMVGKNDSSFKSTPHKHKLNFMRGTKMIKVNATEIPPNHFDFMPFIEILAATKEDQFLDVIGHVVEKNSMKETQKNRKISKIMDATLEDLEGNRIHCTLWDDYAVKMLQFLDSHDPSLPVILILQLCKLKKYLGSMGVSNSFYESKLFLNVDLPQVTAYIERMNAANVELTKVVSQMSGPAVLNVADDLLHTPRMTIEDLIESTQKCSGSVLAWACEFDMDAGWFYQACTKCASRINFVAGQLYCDKCKMSRTSVPRFKVHLQVIDDTGSITFVMFDRVVFQVVGRTAQDLLDAMNDDPRSPSYPRELDMFINKWMLFKVEVTDANLYRNWRGYTVKKFTSDDEVISRFTSLYGINLDANADDASFNNSLFDLGEDALPGALDGVESSYKGDIVKSSARKFIILDEDDLDPSNVDNPSTSKPSEKRSADVDEGQVAAPKETKLACVKIEDDDTSLRHNHGDHHMICESNTEQFDIPSNADILAPLVPNIDVDPMTCTCTTNCEQFGVPSNYADGDGLYDDNNCTDEHTYYDAVAENPAYFNIGQPNCMCPDCGAIMWLEERVKRGSKSKPKFSLCCSKGDIELAPYMPLPEPLRTLYHGGDNRSKFFLENIRSFNSMFAFTSMGGKIETSLNDGNAPPVFLMNGENYHLIGSLLPLPDRPPKFAQLYIYDTDNEISNRMASVGDIRFALHRCNNPYVRAYTMIRDTLNFQASPNIKLRLLGKRCCDGRRYNLPSTSEVALVVGDFDSADFDRDVVVQTQTGLLQRISTFEPAYWPLHTIESDRLRYMRDHQKDLRAAMYKGLTEAILKGDCDATTAGKRIVLPASFVGGARYMIQNYQDEMSICAWAGYPDIFVTFTCNHKWPEIVEFLKVHKLRPSDRPDLISRLFKISRKAAFSAKLKQAANNRTIYFKLSPFISVRTTGYAPSTVGNRKIFYQEQHYFMI